MSNCDIDLHDKPRKNKMQVQYNYILFDIYYFYITYDIGCYIFQSLHIQTQLSVETSPLHYKVMK